MYSPASACYNEMHMAVIGVKIMQATFTSNRHFMQLSAVGMPLLLLQMVHAVALVPPLAPQ